MRWMPNRPRAHAVAWRSHPLPATVRGDRRRLCDLLNADSLDDLARIACNEAAHLGLARLFIVSWNVHQLGPWAIYPHTAEDRILSTTIEERLTKLRDQIVQGAAESDLRSYAHQLGFDGMAIVPSRRHLIFHVFWLGRTNGDCAIDLRSDGIWSDLEVALCNFARLDQLRELSHTDTLTNVFNRRYFNLRLTEEFSRAQRFSRPLSLAICDLDRFKALNDQHGHLTGDVVLRYMAQTLRRSVRGIDIVCRLGGDEFAVLMPDTDSDEIPALAERLLHAVSSGGFTLGGRESGAPLELRLSVGVAVYPRHADKAERLLWGADMALLEAKRTGGNRFAVCDPAQLPHRTGSGDTST